MTIALRSFQIAVLALAPVTAGAAWAGGASPWAEGFHSRVRLIEGGKENGKRLAGIEIILDKGFKTYWRTPGEAGLPPRLDWSGTRNAADLVLRWPAPSRLEDVGGISYVYPDRVILPVIVRPTNPGQPVELRLNIDFGVCKDICIPANAQLNLTLSGDEMHRPEIARALAAVPRQQPIGAEGSLTVVDATPLPGEKPSFSVRVRAPAGTKPELFAEGPDDWYVSTSPTQERDRFTVTVDERPKEAPTTVPLRLTLVAGGQAVEVELPLDPGVVPR